MFSGGHQKASWDILETFVPQRNNNSLRKGGTESKERVQVILTAATLPSKSPKSIGTLLKRWLPQETVYMSTDNTHQVLSNSQFRFEYLTESKATDTKFQSLIDELMALEDKNESQKVLVFCNTLSNVEELYNKLDEFMCPPSPSPPKSSSWWSNKVGQLHKHITPEKRVSLIEKFNLGDIKVLISTDLSSRGLDIPDIGSVIMYDFPTGTVEFLHRAGRTARAGKPGKGMELKQCDTIGSGVLYIGELCILFYIVVPLCFIESLNYK